MKFTAPLRILAVAAICVVTLIGLVINESRARASGTEVLLAIEAVDPRSLLSGHYVIVGLVSSLPPDQDCNGAPPSIDPSDPIEEDRWLALRLDGAVHRLSGAAPTREEALSHGPIAVLGTAFCNPRVLDAEGKLIQPANERLDLGVDRFHINQSEAERIERVLREARPGEARAFAIVSIGRDGHARLIGLQIDGERLELSWS
jgi:hypothetical protein